MDKLAQAIADLREHEAHLANFDDDAAKRWRAVFSAIFEIADRLPPMQPLVAPEQE